MLDGLVPPLQGSISSRKLERFPVARIVEPVSVPVRKLDAVAGDGALIAWDENGTEHTARWRTANDAPAPSRLMVIEDHYTAKEAYRDASQGVALLWRGDFQNARQLLEAIERRAEGAAGAAGGTTAEAFYRYRQARAHRARILSMLLIPLDAGGTVPLRRPPEIREALAGAYGAIDEPSLVSLREVIGAIGANEWRRKGIHVDALDASIHPHYGAFFPVRSEYVDLVAQAPLPATDLAFDIGTGTGVLAAVLAKRGVERVVATDSEERAVVCARENLARLGLDDRVEVEQIDMFPPGRASLVVCNPPWVPATSRTLMDNAVYDPKSRMLLRFLGGLALHLTPDGEGWLVLSDLAEHLGLRTRQWLLDAIENAGLVVVDRLDTRPTHPRVGDADDPLHVARTKEVTSLWRLAVMSGK